MIQRIRKERLKNTLRTTALIGGMLGLVLLLGYLLMGVEGLIWAGILGVAMMVLSTNVPTKYIMRMYRARKLSSNEIPNVSRVMRILADRADLKKTPDLYYIPNRMLNAFATGGKGDPAIAVTHGLLSQLSLREITGVLAHEVSHIKNRDHRLKSIANIMGRITRMFSFVGQLLLFINLPLFLMGEATIPWLAIGLLIVAPFLSGLMMMAISRTRERDADLEAARLTGDPNGLADALQKLNYLNNGGILERMVPKNLSSHPKTKERVDRLRELAPKFSPKIEFPDEEQTSIGSSGQNRGWW